MASYKIGQVTDETGALVPIYTDHNIVTIGQYQLGRQAVLDLMRHAAAAIWQAAENGQRGRGGVW